MSTLKVSTISPLGTDATNTITIGTNGTDTVTGACSMVPAFFARLSSNQSISSDTSTKIQVDTEIFDSDDKYDNSTNYRFTPTIAGKYFVFAGVRFDNQISQATMRAELSFNGSIIGSNFLAANDSSTNKDYTIEVSCIQIFDSDDYIELFAQSDGSGSQTINGDSTNKTYFGAYKLIGA